MSLLVVFGAGASFDSVALREPGASRSEYRVPDRDPAVPLLTDAEHQARPPLADNIFDRRSHFMRALRAYPMLDDIAPQLQRRPAGQTIEMVLEQMQLQAAHHPRRLPQLAALRYYLSDVIGICESQWLHESPVQLNHSALLDMINTVRAGRHCIFVTFNYDRLIEFAVTRSSGRTFATLADYVTRGEIPLVKLHGSIGWERRVAMNGAVQQASADDKRRVICDQIERLGELGPVEMTPSRQRSPWLPTIPAIAVPLQTKLKFECPDDHVERLKEELPAVRSVLCIGWRAGEQAFLDLAQDYCPNVVSVTAVCGRMEDSQATTSVLQRVFPRAAMEPIGSGFTDAIGTRQLMGAIVRAWPPERNANWPELEFAIRRPDGPSSILRR